MRQTKFSPALRGISTKNLQSSDAILVARLNNSALNSRKIDYQHSSNRRLSIIGLHKTEPFFSNNS